VDLDHNPDHLFLPRILAEALALQEDPSFHDDEEEVVAEASPVALTDQIYQP
jgi:hypothetical protein